MVPCSQMVRHQAYPSISKPAALPMTHHDWFVAEWALFASVWHCKGLSKQEENVGVVVCMMMVVICDDDGDDDDDDDDDDL